MMSNTTCVRCGAEMTPEARFCRQCGQPSARVNPPNSVTEATTRILETPPAQTVMPPHFDAQPTSMAYQPPPQTQSVSSATTQDLAPARQPRHWLLAGLLVFALIALISLTFTTMFWRHRVVRRVVQPPAIPLPPRPPPPPPPGRPPFIAPDAMTISPDLIYPGARTTMDITSAKEGRVLQLHTQDSLDQVVDWYAPKFALAKIIKTSRSNVVMESDRIKAVITAAGDGTNILLKQDAERD